jgi:methylthioribose-1-phosphate isomerase
MKPLEWRKNRLINLDQTRLPGEEVYLEITHCQDVATAIQRLAVRGAPAIGIAAAYGMALGALEIQAKSKADFLKKLQIVSKTLADSRPTARNLFWAIERMIKKAQETRKASLIPQYLIEESIKIHAEQIESDKTLSRLGATLINNKDLIVTHCNAGAAGGLVLPWA